MNVFGLLATWARGATIEKTPVEIWATFFADNIGTGLVLGEGTSGIIDQSHFRNNPGLQLTDVDELIVRRSNFENTPLGLVSDNARPTVMDNTFENNLVALEARGNRVPVALSRNVFLGNPTAVENLSASTLAAQDNYWGTTDSTEINAMIKGAVDWMPYLSEEPGQTEISAPAEKRPTRFTLYAGYPNPFNAQTTIRFDIVRSAAIEMKIYDMLGRSLRQWQWQQLEPGRYEQVWDGRDQDGRAVATGVYFYQLRTAEFTGTGRLLLLR